MCDCRMLNDSPTFAVVFAVLKIWVKSDDFINKNSGLDQIKKWNFSGVKKVKMWRIDIEGKKLPSFFQIEKKPRSQEAL